MINNLKMLLLPRWSREEEGLQILEEPLEVEGSDSDHLAKERSKKAD